AKDKPSRSGRVRCAKASSGRCVRTGGRGGEVRQFRVMTLGGSLVQRERLESGARKRCMEGKERQSLAAAGLMLGAAHTIRRAAILLLWGTRTEMGGRQASAANIVVGVVLKQFVVHRWTWRQKTSIFVSMPLVGTRRSAPYNSIGRRRA